MRSCPFPLLWLAALLSAVAAAPSAANEDRGAYSGPVIDMHLHASHAGDNGPPGAKVCVGAAADMRWDQTRPWRETMGGMALDPPCKDPLIGSLTDAQNRDDAIAALKRRRVTAVLSGDLEEIAYWQQGAPEGTFIPALYFNQRRMDEWTPQKVAAAHKAGTIRLLAEVTLQYDGIFADDPRFEPWLAMAEENDIPVGIHVGVGPPGSPHVFPEYRIQNPMHLEAVMLKHPKLRVYAMHAGWPFSAEMKALFYAFPQLMVDTGVLQMALTRKEYHAWLKDMVDAGYADRIMFGSDQMNWPGMIEEGIDAINRAPFLTREQKKAILHDNAARFLRLGS